MRLTEVCSSVANVKNSNPSPRLDTGPAIDVRNSAIGELELFCAISDTPPKMNSVICRTSTPSRRATRQWLSSCNSTHANRPSEVTVPANQYVNPGELGACIGTWPDET